MCSVVSCVTRVLVSRVLKGSLSYRLTSLSLSLSLALWLQKRTCGARMFSWEEKHNSNLLSACSWRPFRSKFISLSATFNTSTASFLLLFSSLLIYFSMLLVSLLHHSRNLKHQSTLSYWLSSVCMQSYRFHSKSTAKRRDASSRLRGYILTSVNASAKCTRVDALSLEPLTWMTRTFYFLSPHKGGSSGTEIEFSLTRKLQLKRKWLPFREGCTSLSGVKMCCFTFLNVTQLVNVITVTLLLRSDDTLCNVRMREGREKVRTKSLHPRLL